MSELKVIDSAEHHTILERPSQYAIRSSSEEGSPLLKEGMFEKMMQLAEVMATSQTLPQHFHNKPGDCLRIVELAYRVRQSPYAIADWCYFIGGKLALEGKGIAALINSSAAIDGALNYEYSGGPKDAATFVCKVTGRRRGETKDRQIEVTQAQGLADCKGAKNRWLSDPYQMLSYYGARVWARRHAPEVIGGWYTPEELESVEQGTPYSSNSQVTVQIPPPVAFNEYDDLKEKILTSTTLDELESHIPALQFFKGSKLKLDNLRKEFKQKMTELKFIAEQEQQLNQMEKPNNDDAI